MPRTLRRRAAAFLIAGAALGVGAPPTAAAPVEGGSLAWLTVNDFGPAARTWFGYVTNPSPAGGANGTVTPVAPTFGPTLSGASPRGAAVRWGMPAVAGGDYDPATRTGTIEFDGELRYASTLHGFDYSLVDPQVVLDGANSKLYASGVKVEGTTSGTFDRSQPVFDLDLSGATFTDTQVTGIAPSIATAAWGFPATYPVGAGPDRNPNTFGSFTLTFGATLSATPTTGLDPAGATVTVTGEGFKTSGAGAYLFFGPVDGRFATDSVAPVKYLRPASIPAVDRIETDGSFSTTLTLRSTGGSGAGAFDCAKVACAIRTIAAHTDADPTQRTTVPVTFAPPAPPPPAPGPAPATPAAPVTPAKPAAPALSRVSLSRGRLVFRVSLAGRVTARIQRRVVRRVRRGGRTRRVVTFRLVKTVRVNAPAAGRYRRKVTLPAGRYRVVVRAVTATGGKSKPVTQNVRLR